MERENEEKENGRMGKKGKREGKKERENGK
jgi:hypothetical protein